MMNIYGAEYLNISSRSTGHPGFRQNTKRLFEPNSYIIN